MRLLIALTVLSVALSGCKRSDDESTADSSENTTAAETNDTEATHDESSDVMAPPLPDAAVIMKVNLNTASEATFKDIPNVGDKMAHEFEEYRPYVSIQQFRREMAKYVSADQIAEYEEYVYVPIKMNECDAATLQQIPGVNDVIAQAIMAARPFESADAFFEMLSQHVSPQQAAMARSYLDE